MPITFHVQPDFYDHPKCIGLSDAAVALWVRAGSFSVAKLTDGLITESVLVLLSSAPDEAAGELVRAGLWRRRKGGYVFHQWGERNLTKKDVEQRRENWRKRKQAAPKRIRKPASQQVGGTIFPGESEGNPRGIPRESPEIPPYGSGSGSGISTYYSLESGSHVSSDPPRKREEPRSAPVALDAYLVAKAYADSVPCNPEKVTGAVKAMLSRYQPDQIRAALAKLASKPELIVTADVLRREIESMARAGALVSRDSHGAMRIGFE